MAEELIPGLVKVAEERLGILGRPLTTAMVIAAIIGIIAWGADQAISKIVSPVLTLTGISADSELLGSIVLLSTLTVFLVASVLLTVYLSGRIRSGSANERLQNQQLEIDRLQTLVESLQREKQKWLNSRKRRPTKSNARLATPRR